jgi:hypothetical protein
MVRMDRVHRNGENPPRRQARGTTMIQSLPPLLLVPSIDISV